MILFKPTGTLNISAVATDLPSQGEAGNVYSGAMARCKNLSLNKRAGVAVTRDGSKRLSSSSLAEPPNLIVEQAGTRYAFAGTQIYQDETSIGSGLTDAQWSAIKYNAYNDTTQRIFCLNGTDRKKINGTTVNEWGITPPASAPTVAATGTGLTGTYKAKITYAVKSGSTVLTESNPSPASSGQALSNNALRVTWSASADSQVTHVRVYRTIAGGDIYYHDQDVAVGTTTVDTTTADTSLGTEVETDHDRPPAGTITVGPLYNGVSFIIKDNLLYWSKSKQPEYWPANNFIEVGPPQFPGKAAVIFDGQLYVLTKNQIWWIQGTTPGAFNPVPLESLSGAPNIFGAIAIKGKGIYHLGADGIYLYFGGRDVKISEAEFDPIFPNSGSDVGSATNGMDFVPAEEVDSLWLHQYQNKVYFHYGEGNVIVSNVDNQKSSYYKYDQALSAPVTDKTNDRFLVGDSGKYIREIEASSQPADIGKDIEWEVQSKDYTLQTRKHFPRWAKYDVDTSSASSVEGKVILDDAIHHTHSITNSRSTKRRLVDTGNGDRLAIRITGTGQASIYAAELE